MSHAPTARPRSILITGCSSGIGAAAALALRARGWRVFAACRQAEDCARLRAEGFESPRLDYTDPASLDQALSEVLEATGGTLDALFNNGAIALPGAVEDLPTEALRAIFETNLFGWHDLTRRVIPVMRAQGHERIVNCSSVLGLVGARWRGAYAATKFALEGLSEVLRLEMAPANIQVVLIEPGPITSRLRQNAIPHFERWIDWRASPRRDDYEAVLHRLYGPATPDRWELPPSAVAERLILALESRHPAPRYRVTATAHAAGLLRRALPGRALDWVLRRS
ncbi:SDR family NAD(P)-dependent oxidoreductase [Rubellimicrobium aerolatum]|uniref:SDR family NAD(P)-dependent oxidoreductase n=1 Tax=Rubellimicrobium aerolatum TaxID=490979 RepID=A0ABW0SD91_9RHOB|nr:SDR family NAD(P)-dependent oxidoreductase [Rubellimicrobium aerolatum]MBP1806735.1 NAD(P)-dependent dehydrogenase (short-subunit alcohol dehydrogenase family) [Rubellimicrobium aerolatum]